MFNFKGPSAFLIGIAFAFAFSTSCGVTGRQEAQNNEPESLEVSTSTDESDGAVFEGDINRELVRRTIRSRLRYVRDCFFSHPPNQQGQSQFKFLVRLQIHKGGEAKSVRIIYNSENDEQAMANLGTCVIDVFAATKFPSPREGRYVEVIYPIKFVLQRK